MGKNVKSWQPLDPFVPRDGEDRVAISVESGEDSRHRFRSIQPEHQEKIPNFGVGADTRSYRFASAALPSYFITIGA